MVATTGTSAPPPVPAPPHLRVVYASFWRRFWALWIDVIFLAMIAGLIDMAVNSDAQGGIVLLVIGVYLIATTMGGGSVGKRMLSLRVVRTTGAKVDPIRAFLREIVMRPLSLVCAGIGTLWMLDSPRRQTWHDSIAGTIVVREVFSQAGPEWGSAPPWRPVRDDDDPEPPRPKDRTLADRLSAYDAPAQESSFGSRPAGPGEGGEPDGPPARRDDADDFFRS